MKREEVHSQKTYLIGDELFNCFELKLTLKDVCPVCKLKVQKTEIFRIVISSSDGVTDDSIKDKLDEQAAAYVRSHPFLICRPCQKKTWQESL